MFNTIFSESYLKTMISSGIEVVSSDLQFLVESEEGYPQYELGSLKQFLQRSKCFVGNQTELFHEKLKSSNLKLANLVPDEVYRVQGHVTNDIWCDERDIFLQCSLVTNVGIESFTGKLSKWYSKNSKHLQYREWSRNFPSIN